MPGDDAAAHIGAVVDEVVRLMDEAFTAVDHRPPAGSSLDQLSLLGGEQVVDDLLEHGEPGLALEHVLYMVEEPPLRISAAAFAHLEAAAAMLGLPSSRVEAVRPD